jgi:hypothetical protein
LDNLHSCLFVTLVVRPIRDHNLRATKPSFLMQLSPSMVSGHRFLLGANQQLYLGEVLQVIYLEVAC